VTAFWRGRSQTFLAARKLDFFLPELASDPELADTAGSAGAVMSAHVEVCGTP
jgi:hypothetical protein